MRTQSFVSKLEVLAPMVGLAAILSVGCSGESAGPDPEAYTLPDEQGLAEESNYMRDVFNKVGAGEGAGYIRLDLSDVKQYRFLVHRLLRSGNVPENAPRLFASVERTRALHLERRAIEAVDEADGERVRSVQQALETEPCALFLEAPLQGTATQSTTTATNHGNCFGGQEFPYGYADIATFKTDAAHTNMVGLGYNYIETFNGAADFKTPATVGFVPTGTGELHYSDGIAYVEAADGEVYSAYTAVEDPALPVPASITSVVHPAKFNGGDNMIRHCIKRAAWAGNGDCEYAGVDAAGNPSQTAVGMAKMTYIGGQWKADPGAANRWFPWTGFAQYTNLYVPMAATFDAGTGTGNTACIINQFNSARAVMTLASGGWCINGSAGAPSNDVYENLKTKTGARTATYNTLANFGPDCLPFATGSQNTVPAEVNLTVLAKTSCGAATRKAEMRWTSLDFKDSCFAKGTGILRADGKYVAVEELKMGDLVLSNTSGRMLSVVSMARGGEDHPLVHIIDDKGHDVLLTETHPVVTKEGVMVAAGVNPGMIVETESGLATVIDVTRVQYDDMVYNLTLGTPDELAAIQTNERTMFAGGIRVGDNEVQATLSKTSAPARTEVAAAWRVDYENAVARNANLKE